VLTAATLGAGQNLVIRAARLFWIAWETSPLRQDRALAWGLGALGGPPGGLRPQLLIALAALAGLEANGLRREWRQKGGDGEAAIGAGAWLCHPDRGDLHLLGWSPAAPRRRAERGASSRFSCCSRGCDPREVRTRAGNGRLLRQLALPPAGLPRRGLGVLLLLPEGSLVLAKTCQPEPLGSAAVFARRARNTLRQQHVLGLVPDQTWWPAVWIPTSTTTGFRLGEWVRFGAALALGCGHIGPSVEWSQAHAHAFAAAPEVRKLGGHVSKTGALRWSGPWPASRAEYGPLAAGSPPTSIPIRSCSRLSSLGALSCGDQKRALAGELRQHRSQPGDRQFRGRCAAAACLGTRRQHRPFQKLL